ncbi:ABC transporter ATP-binding protein [Lactonifactor longoviformis]|uniref:Nickel import system ATP-binding protein NikD n=3 Tax=Lactonifactor TaxID=420345 RepID=A0A1M4V131_9CLOT|nr:ABC transporter ATP-binding protein [Lactonifactor longoviformis]SHE62686.1 peptide/nickel transport system ATP-binding protein [Lactonifactor longoviformis DSM 17459]
MKDLLQVKDLNVGFLVGKREVQVLRNVSFSIGEGEILGVIGETGCGKSVTGSAVLRLLPENALVKGEILYKGKEILYMEEENYRELRGKEISAIPQSPGTSLNPMMKVGNQVAECITGKEIRKRESVRTAVNDIFRRLQLPGKDRCYGNYPWELSGGMCQRVLIGMGMITHARLLIVDEPTKAIDWALRKEVADILLRLKQEMGCAMMMITHDIGVASYVADRVAVMYCGEIVEVGKTEDILHHPIHPYTRGLIRAMPANGFEVMEGFMPSFSDLPEGCNFCTRCRYRDTVCSRPQEMEEADAGHWVRCRRWGEIIKSREEQLCS